MKDILKRTWAEISLDNIEYNYKVIRAKMRPDCRFLGVVKADAYGHGAVQVSRLLEKLGADYLAVSNINEALALRDADIRLPILILGYTPVECIDELLENEITQTVYDRGRAEAFSKAAVLRGGRLRIHIKADTGMSRLGFLCDDSHVAPSAEEIAKVAALPGLDAEGIYTHFAAADDITQEEYTAMQFHRFTGLTDTLKRVFGVEFAISHCANSVAVVNYPYTQLDMVRPGLLLYGIAPSAEMKSEIELRPAMTLKTIVSGIKELEKGVTVSYGRTFATEKTSKIAVMPIGYADGLPRLLSNRYEVFLCGKRARISGRICMDMTMLDATEISNVHTGDEIEIFGEHLPVSDAAELAGTIPYELVCGVSKRVPRLFLYHGQRSAILI